MSRSGSVVAAMLLLVDSALGVNAPVHEYAGVTFVSKGNAIIVHGGNEGIYSSSPGLNESSPGNSFIRFVKIIFQRCLEISISALDQCLLFFLRWMIGRR